MTAPGRGDHPEKTSAPDLRTRLALRPKEAAEALGISERTLRGLLPELPHIRVGGVVMIPVQQLEDWLRRRSEAGEGAVDRIAGDIMCELEAE